MTGERKDQAVRNPQGAVRDAVYYRGRHTRSGSHGEDVSESEKYLEQAHKRAVGLGATPAELVMAYSFGTTQAQKDLGHRKLQA
jgi:hypothetical protein